MNPIDICEKVMDNDKKETMLSLGDLCCEHFL